MGVYPLTKPIRATPESDVNRHVTVLFNPSMLPTLL
jgi:hypothetical protein